jgi:hypothetical protein
MVNLASLVLSLSSLTTLALGGVLPRQASGSRSANYGSSTGSTSVTQVGSDVNANPYPTGTTAFETIAPSVTYSTNLMTTANIATASASGGVAASTSTSTSTSTATSTLHLTPAYNNTPSTSTGNNHNGNDADTDTEADNSDGDNGEWPVKYYDFTVTWGDVDANGEIRPAILVNGQTPGPLVELEEGQRVSVSTEVPRFRGDKKGWNFKRLVADDHPLRSGGYGTTDQSQQQAWTADDYACAWDRPRGDDLGGWSTGCDVSPASFTDCFQAAFRLAG